MIGGINCTTVAPLAVSELQRFEALTVESVRFNVPTTEAEIVAFLDPYVGLKVWPLLLFDRLDKMPIAPWAIREALARFGQRFGVEPVNEYRNQNQPYVTLEKAIGAGKELWAYARDLGFTGPVLAPSIMNIDKDRDIPDFKAFAAALPDDVILNVHRYPPKAWTHPPEMADPWPPHTVRASEFYELRQIAGAHPIAFTEFTEEYGSIPYLFGLARKTRTPEDVKHALIDEMRLLDQQGIWGAYPFTWPAGWAGMSMRDDQGNELAHAAALTEWRT